MPINALGNSPTFSPCVSRVTILEQQQLSTTEWKTYFLVITSNLLIIIGVSLAFASFYIITIVHPMVALSGSVLPIAIAAYLQPPESDNKSTDIRGKSIHRPGQPLGLDNVGANCWLHVVFQFFAHIPVLKKALDNTGKFTPFKDALDQYEEEKKAPQYHSNVSSVNTQALREWLHEETREGIWTYFQGGRKNSFKVSPNKDEQIDATDFLQFSLKQIGHSMPVKEKVITDGIDNLKGYQDRKNDPFFTIDFSLGGIDKTNPKLQDLLDKQFFYRSSGIQQTFSKFASPPDDLTICIGHPIGSEGADIPLFLKAKEDQFNGKATYYLDGCIKYEGTDGFGHYACFVRCLGKWVQLSDKVSSGINKNQIKKEARTARILHYTKMIV